MNYNTFGEPTAVDFGSLDSDAFTYDPNTGRMTQYQLNIGSPVKSLVGNLTWNANGTLNQLAITDPLNSSDQQTCTYTYDDLARIASANCAPNWNQSFTADPFGNLTKTGLGGGAISFQPTYNAATNRVSQVGSSVPGYDADGDVTSDSVHSYAWDSDGNSVTIDTVGLTFDALDRMVEQNRSGSYTQIVYNPMGAKLALMTGQTLAKAFVPLAGGATAVYNSSGLAYYRHADWLGSSRLASTPSRALYHDGAYAPYGENYAETGSTDRNFAGMNQDTVSSGSYPLYDALFREYHPTWGRWVSPDPAGLAAAGASNPQSWNRYAYVLNNPLGLVDPLGLDEGGGGNGPCVVDPRTNTVICTPGGIGGGGPGGGGPCAQVVMAGGFLGPDTARCGLGGGGGGRPGPPRPKAKPPNKISPCINIPSNGKTIPVQSSFGQVNFQFNGQGSLIGVGLQLTGQTGFQAANLSIPPNTFVGLALTSAGTVQFGFNNPVDIGSGVSQAYFQSGTFSGGQFTSVTGAYAPFGIPFGSSTGNSSLLLWALNGDLPFTSGLSSQAQQFGNLLTGLASFVSNNVGCNDVFGGS